MLRKMRGRWFLAAIEPHTARPKPPAKASSSRRKASNSRRKKSAAIVALPKGAIDPGEKPEQAAIREVQEETGLHAEVVAKLADTKYVYVRNWGDHARVFKIVSFYLLLYRSGRLGDIAPEMRIEVQRAFWLPLEVAPKALSYGGEREVAKRALEYINKHPEPGAYATNPAH